MKTASLTIYDLNGRQLKSIPVAGRGTTSATIDGRSLQPGMYHYALLVDATLVDTKVMVVTK